MLLSCFPFHMDRREHWSVQHDDTHFSRKDSLIPCLLWRGCRYLKYSSGEFSSHNIRSKTCRRHISTKLCSNFEQTLVLKVLLS